ncbi:hypothetical protein QVD17_32555 [Tagetes erecta]|uniref:Heat stress transcription factor n=1 Tax=Tagetes erecta TaxID=13708 RepID=A0AAD8JXJ8_TARER|nr:hypothetical protein QVD17_32555 [Tagetes erecta]
MKPHSSSFQAGSDPVSHRSSSSSPSTVSVSSTLGDMNVVTVEDGEIIPQPMDQLYGTQIPPFLSKTYDLVDDPILDPIISWSKSGQSFVVWDPVEFSRIILPRNFKHNNFSSFVRQLNTYGFRKIDPEKWEFANESFLRGHKYVLKNIQRRRSSQSIQSTSTTNNTNKEFNKMLVEVEIKRLHKQKMEMLQQIMELKNKNREAHQCMESVNQKLKAAEHKHMHMVSFLAKMIQNPQENTQVLQLLSPNTTRKFVKRQTHYEDPLSVGGSSRNLEPDAESETAPGCLMEPSSVGIDDVTVKHEDIWSDNGNYELSGYWQGDCGFMKMDP